MTEQWRDVLGYEGWYQVSDQGRVKRVGNNKGAKVGRILSPKPDKYGYVRPMLSRGGDERKVGVHQLVMLAFVGACPAGKEVNHKNGIKTDNRLENLEYLNRMEHYRHTREVLGYPNPTVYADNRGEAAPKAKLTTNDVIVIRALIGKGECGFSEIARRFNVTEGAIRHIACGITWKHFVTPPVQFPGGLTDEHAARLCWFNAHGMDTMAAAAYRHHHMVIGQEWE